VFVPSEKQAKLFVKYHDLGWIGPGLDAFAALTPISAANAVARHSTASEKIVRQLLPAQGSRLRDLMSNRTSVLPGKTSDWEAGFFCMLILFSTVIEARRKMAAS
jgi:hypothetical protein